MSGFLSQNSTFTMSNSNTSAAETSQPDIGDVADQPLSMPMFEPVALEADSGTGSVHGSARTSFTYQDIVRERDRRKGNTSPASTDLSSSSRSMSVRTDVVLGTGLLWSSQDSAHSSLLQVTYFGNIRNNILLTYSETSKMCNPCKLAIPMLTTYGGNHHSLLMCEERSVYGIVPICLP
jgi:hypothetical protein